MAEIKSDDSGDLEILEDDILSHAHMHMYEWGYLQNPQKWFHLIDDKLQVLKHFELDHFTREGGDEDWKANLEELKLIPAEEQFKDFMTGKMFNDEKVAKKLRAKMQPRLKSLGIWMSIYDALGWRTINEAKALRLLREHAAIIDLSYQFKTVKDAKNIFGPLKPVSDSLLSFGIQQGNDKFVGLLLDIEKPEPDELNRMCELAKTCGQWHIYQKLEQTRLGKSVYERVEKEKDKIEKTQAVVFEFLREDVKTDKVKTSNKSGVFDELFIRVRRALESHSPISDELLLIAWRLSVKKAKNPLSSKMWKVLKDVCLDVLKIPLDKVQWKWFTLYLLHSTLWHEKIGKDRTLYDELIELVKTQWKKPKEYLKENIKKIENTEGWKGVIGIEEINPSTGPVRQTETYGQPYKPVQSEFGIDQLKEMSLISGTNMISFYDMSGYLSNMVIRAYELDGVFHDSMRGIFGVNEITNKNDAGDVLYTAGPVKTGERCQAKAQNDYGTANVPTTANIVDIIRGSLVFKTVNGLLDGFNILVKAIRSGQTAIKHIVRIKNTLQSNEEKRKTKGIYRYGDIKLNVLIAKGGRAIVGEVQLMTKFMLEAKKMDHELYEIVRRKAFVANVQNALSLNATKQQAFVKAAIESNTAHMSQLFINFPYPEIDVFKLDEDGDGYAVIHRVCLNGNYKAFNLILKSFIPKSEVPKMVSLRAGNGDTPLMVVCQWCQTSGHYTILSQLLTKYRKFINLNAQNKAGNFAVQLAAMNGRLMALDLMCKQDDVNFNLQDDNKWTPLMASVECGQLGSAELLLENHEKMDVNIPMASGTSPFMSASFLGYSSIIPKFLNCPSCNINYQRPRDDFCAIMFCNQNGHTSTCRLIARDKRVKINVTTSYGLTPLGAAANGGHIGCVKALLEERGDEIDWNVQDGYQRTTPVISAARGGYPEIVKYLLKFDKQDLSLKDRNGKTALDYAKEGNHDEMAEMIIQKMWS